MINSQKFDLMIVMLHELMSRVDRISAVGVDDLEVGGSQVAAAVGSERFGGRLYSDASGLRLPAEDDIGYAHSRAASFSRPPVPSAPPLGAGARGDYRSKRLLP